MSNFLFLESYRKYSDFMFTCMEAEKLIIISPNMSVVCARKAVEQITRWLYDRNPQFGVFESDVHLRLLVQNEEFQAFLPSPVFHSINAIINLGNDAVHRRNDINERQALKMLHYLFDYMYWAFCLYENLDLELKFSKNNIPLFNVEKNLDRERRQKILIEHQDERIANNMKKIERQKKLISVYRDNYKFTKALVARFKKIIGGMASCRDVIYNFLVRLLEKISYKLKSLKKVKFTLYKKPKTSSSFTLRYQKNLKKLERKQKILKLINFIIRKK